MVGGKPMIEHITEKLEEIRAIDDIYVVTNNKFYKHFLKWASGYKGEKKIEIINDGTMTEDDRLGAIGDIHDAVKQKKVDDDIFIIAGDNLFDFDIFKLVDKSEENDASAIGLYKLTNLEEARKFGVVAIDYYDKITEFEEKPQKPKSTLIATACYFLIKEDLEELEKCITEKKKPDNMGEFIRHLSQRKPVYGVIYEKGWIDIGSLEQLKQADIKYGGDGKQYG
jgi:glucose-1-phosphate thymidylyltransferase